MHILVLEPFGGGSHAAWCAGWAQHSRHALTVLDLPAVHWKWRSRHAALTLAEMARQAWSAGQRFDAIVCSDMLDLAAWKGLVGDPLNRLPTVAYFHENQLTYPLSPGQRRDYHFGYTNILSAVAAEETWFNSDFHRREFCAAATSWLRRMPDYRHLDLLDSAMQGARVVPPGIEPCPWNREAPERRPDKATEPGPRSGLPTGRPLRLGWVARWEHDKRPDRFVELIERLLHREIPFELILLGQRFARGNDDHLQRLRTRAGDRILFDGFAESRDAYWHRLSQIDVVISTADHEFFGVGICEAIDAGAIPLLPNHLAYPEILAHVAGPQAARYLYDSLDEAAELLESWLWDPAATLPPRLDMRAYHWSHLAPRYDNLLSDLVKHHG